jgi:hypothetical protein
LILSSFHYSKLGEADPGGLGACPQEKDLQFLDNIWDLSSSFDIEIFFHYSKLGEADPGVWGLAPKKKTYFAG